MNKYEYLLIKKNGNQDGLVYDKLVYLSSEKARKEFKKDDILFKCKKDSVYYSDNGWTVKDKDIVARYEK